MEIRYTLVEYMPRHLRANHTQAGNHGVYPHNGAVRIYVEHEVSSEDLDPTWARIVEDNIRPEDIPEGEIKGTLEYHHAEAYRPLSDEETD